MPDDVKKYNVKANGFVFSFTKDEIDEADLIALSPVSFNLIKDKRVSNAKLLDASATSKRLIIEIEGETFDVEIKDELDQVLDQMGFGKASINQDEYRLHPTLWQQQ